MQSSIEIAKSLVTLFEIIACIAGFINWRKIKNSYWKYFPFYLLAIVIIEVLGYFLDNTIYTNWNIDLYKYISFPLQFLFFHWLFAKANIPANKIWIIGCSIVYLLSVFVEEFFLKYKKMPFSSFSYMIGCLTLIILCVCYFVYLIKSDNILHFNQDLLFWVSLGIVLFYIGTFPYYGLFNTLAVKKYRYIHYAYTWVQTFLDYAMYLLFTIGFIWAKPKLK